MMMMMMMMMPKWLNPLGMILGPIWYPIRRDITKFRYVITMCFKFNCKMDLGLDFYPCWGVEAYGSSRYPRWRPESAATTGNSPSSSVRSKNSAYTTPRCLSYLTVILNIKYQSRHLIAFHRISYDKILYEIKCMIQSSCRRLDTFCVTVMWNIDFSAVCSVGVGTRITLGMGPSPRVTSPARETRLARASVEGGTASVSTGSLVRTTICNDKSFHCILYISFKRKQYVLAKSITTGFCLPSVMRDRNELG